MSALPSPLDCRKCGACCIDQVIVVGTGDNVPPLLVESEGPLDVIRKQGGRCVCLLGRLGIDTRCSIYPRRPAICSVLPPGSEPCLVLRSKWGIA